MCVCVCNFKRAAKQLEKLNAAWPYSINSDLEWFRLYSHSDLHLSTVGHYIRMKFHCSGPKIVNLIKVLVINKIKIQQKYNETINKMTILIYTIYNDDTAY